MRADIAALRRRLYDIDKRDVEYKEQVRPPAQGAGDD